MIGTIGTFGTIGTRRTTPTVPLQTPFHSMDARHELLRLMVLRQLEDSGPCTGSEALDAVASLTCSFDVASPGYPLLHELRDAGLVGATVERPPRYAITDLGRREADLLASRCWPAIRDGLARFNVCVGCLAPRRSGAGGDG
jgi:DNA-binding PadR family transcriptional regulator